MACCMALFHKEMPQPSITKICLEITGLKFISNIPRANELMNDGGVDNGHVGDGGDGGISSSSINSFLPVFITFHTHHLLVPFQKVGWWYVYAVNMMVKIYSPVSPAIYVLHINEKKSLT